MAKHDQTRSISFSIPLITIVFLVLLFFTFPQNLLISRILSQEITSIQNENIRKITQSMKESLVLELEANEYILRGYGMGLSGEKQILRNIREEANEGSLKYANNAVMRVKESNPHFETVFIADSDGAILVSTDESLLGENISDREYFQAILLVENEIYTSPKPMVSRSTGSNIIVHATSIRQGGKIVGLLGVSLDLDRMGHELILSKKLGETGEPFVLDREGHYLISNDESLLMTRAQDQDPLYQMILDSPLTSQTTSVTIAGDLYHASFEKYPGLNWTIGLTMAEKELYESVYTIRRMMIFLTVVLIIAVSLILFFYIRLRLVKKILSVEDLITTAPSPSRAEAGSWSEPPTSPPNPSSAP